MNFALFWKSLPAMQGVTADYRQSISHLPCKRGYLKTLILSLHDLDPIPLHGSYYRPSNACEGSFKGNIVGQNGKIKIVIFADLLNAKVIFKVKR